jgi:hypothetical protein
MIGCVAVAGTDPLFWSPERRAIEARYVAWLETLDPLHPFHGVSNQ